MHCFYKFFGRRIGMEGGRGGEEGKEEEIEGREEGNQ